MAARPQDILGFWTDAGPKRWFEKNRGFDEAIRLKYEPTHHAAARGDYDDWVETPEGSLALIIVLDQFSPRSEEDPRDQFDQHFTSSFLKIQKSFTNFKCTHYGPRHKANYFLS